MNVIVRVSLASVVGYFGGQLIGVAIMNKIVTTGGVLNNNLDKGAAIVIGTQIATGAVAYWLLGKV